MEEGRALRPPAPRAAEARLPLVGRQRELALLEQVLDGAGPPLLLLAGEPGIGKTRLLQVAAQRAGAQGWSVLAGGCQRRGGQDPYSPLLDALAQHLLALPPEALCTALAGCAWLARLLPELAEALEPLPGGAVSPEQERRLMYAAVARLLANVAGPAGTLLVLDDLQWAGPDALDLLGTLVSAPARAPAREEGARGPQARWGAGLLRIVGAYRDTEMRPGDPLGHLCADLAQAGLVRHYALGPLAPAEAAALLADLLGDHAEAAAERAARTRVLERAGGLPFFLVSYAQALRTRPEGEESDTGAAPWDVAQGVRQREALLPEAAQQLLSVAAVVGRHAPWALLAAVSGQSEEEVLGGLEAAARARLLLEDGGDAYTFVHDVIREVVEADLGAARRSVLHRRVAEALEASPAASPEVLAYHYARSDAGDKALKYLELAGDRAAAQSAPGAAECHYQALLDRLGSVGRAQDVARVRDKLGEVFCRTGKFDAALPLLEAAADGFRAAGDWESLVRVAARIGWAHSRRGTPRDGIARMTLFLQLLDHNGASPPRGPLYEALGQALYIAGHYQEALAACERAADLARAAGDDRTRVLAQWHRVNLLMILGRLKDALQVGQEALPLAEALGDALCLTRAHRILAEGYALCGALETGRKHLAQARAAAEQLGDAGQQSIALSMCGWLALLRGEGQEARATLDRALELGRQVDGVVYTTYPLFCLARLALVEGDWATTATVGREAVALAERGGDLQGLRWSSGVMAELEILEGRPEAAAARLRPLLDRPSLEEVDVTMLLPVLAWAELDLGQVEQGAEALGQALVRCRREEIRLPLVEALRVQALIALHQGCWEDAACSLEEGLALARGLPYPYAEARLLHLDGQMHAQQGEPALAQERLEAALAIFRRLGARRDAAQADQALAALSQNPPPCEHRSAPSFATRMTDEQWAAIEALLAPGARTGRPRTDDRRTLEAILYKLDTGCGWHAIPPTLGAGVTAYRRLRAWQAAGMWEPIQALVPRERA